MIFALTFPRLQPLRCMQRARRAVVQTRTPAGRDPPAFQWAGTKEHQLNTTYRAAIIAGTALAISGPAFAGRSQEQIAQNDKVVKQKQMRNQQGLAGPVGERGRIGSGTKPTSNAGNIGHPTERVRR